jgi:hypothetical protein
MSLQPFNTVGGLSVGEDQTAVIDDQGNGEFNDLTADGLVDLGEVDNLTILGGEDGQVLTTNGFGALSFTTPQAGGDARYSQFIRVLSRDIEDSSIPEETSVGWDNGMNINSYSRFYIVYARQNGSTEPVNVLSFTS